ncbi:MAG: lytic murein transglycosylase, partial [Proteobacteria bacterium]|nr:lytic murein transglycosylase [Pseudomonadota bacterium]
PAGFDPSLASLKVVKRMGEWQALGVRRIGGADLPARQLEASIVVPDEESGRAFLVYENFRNILKWNRSNYFALTVGLLADGIAGR